LTHESEGSKDAADLVGHPDDNELAALVWGSLPSERRQALAAHLDACRDCRLVLSEIAVDEKASEPTDGLPGIGARLGRYVVRKVLGSGGMGIVFECFDPELDRRLAVKLLRRSGPREEAWVAEEARTLARVVHPNVISVYDVGTWNGRIYVSMELAEAGTLRSWSKAQPRSWREALVMIRQAAAGLAASHRAGIVHGDVKPENVLLGADGRPRLADFGLARSSHLSGSGGGGTPGYLAPELKTNPAPSEASDQFAFCVMAAELLSGVRPATQSELSLPPFIPVRVRVALRRGLAADPTDRWSKFALLEKALQPPSRTVPFAIAAAMLLVFGGTFALWRSDACHGSLAPAPLGEPTAEDLALAERAAANPQWLPVVRSLEHWRAEWSATRTEVCGGARAERPVRLACLRQRREELRALTQTLSGPADDTPGAISLALTSTVGQPTPRSCLEEGALRTNWRSPSFDTVLAKTFADLRARIELRRGAPPDSELQALRVQASKAGEAASLEADQLWAEAPQMRGEYKDAVARWQQVLTAAERLGDDARVFDAALQLAQLEAVELGSVERAETWLMLARGKLERIGASELRRASFEGSEARILMLKGNETECLKHCQAAYDLRRSAVGDGHYLTLQALTNLGLAYGRRGDSVRSFAVMAEAVEGFKRLLGQDTTLSMAAVSNLAGIAADLENYEQELDFGRRALELKQQAFGKGHKTEVVEELYQVEALAGLGRCDEAVSRLIAAQDRLRASFPSPHLVLGWGFQMGGKVYLLCRHFPQALEQFETAAKVDGARGATAEVLDSTSYRAVVSWRAGQREPALALAREVLESKDPELSSLSRARASFVVADLTWSSDPSGAAQRALDARPTLKSMRVSGPELEGWLKQRKLGAD
jgi:tetratricopeptide (TPR) repeat protein